jgi:hypothetical protein
MVTNYPQPLTSTRTNDTGSEVRNGGVVGRLIAWLSQMLCGLHGHESVLHFEQNRILLRCTSCGHDSPGWDVGPRRPRVRFAGDQRRHLSVAPDQLPMRKTA